MNRILPLAAVLVLASIGHAGPPYQPKDTATQLNFEDIYNKHHSHVHDGAGSTEVVSTTFLASNYIDIGDIRIALGDLTGKNGDSVVVTFPGGGFGAIPVILPTEYRADTEPWTTAWSTISATAVTMFVNVETGGAVGGVQGSTMTWVAIGQKP